MPIQPSSSGTASRRLLVAVCAAALAACGPAPGVSGGGVPPTAVPGGMLAGRDPVGFLLQWRDTIGIPDSTANQLVRLNLRLFRRNREVQMRLDSLMRGVRLPERMVAMGDTSMIPDTVRQRTAPLRALIDSQTAAVKDTAWSMLTEGQRSRADSLENELRTLMRRRNGPTMGPTGAGAGSGRP